MREIVLLDFQKATETLNKLEGIGKKCLQISDLSLHLWQKR